MRRDGHARGAVWAHDSHLGDARSTQMGEEGELNAGQLVRERHGAALGELREPLLERAIGVVYRPRTGSHDFEARVAQQFDAVVHVDRTRALEPLERTQMWTAGPPETFPSAL